MAEIGTLPASSKVVSLTSQDVCDDSDDVEIDVTDDVEIDVVTSSPSSRASSPTDVDVTNDYDDVRSSSPSCSPSPVSCESPKLNDDKDADDDIIKSHNYDIKSSPQCQALCCDIPEPCKVTSSPHDIPMMLNGHPQLPKYPRDHPGPTHPSWGNQSHPFLALSFQRLQEIHMRALQERLKYNMGVYGLSSPHQPPMFNPSSPPTTQNQRNLPYMGAPIPEPIYPTNPVIQPEVLRPLPNLKWDMDSHRTTWGHDLNTPLNLVTKLSPDSVSGSTGSSPGSSAGSPGKAPWIPGPPQGSPVKLPWSPESLQLDLSAETPRRRREEPPRYVCEACSKSYATFSGLSKHKQFHCASHIKKQFNCKFCDKTYVSLGALKMHIRTHTLPCKCPLCGKAFSRPWLLQGHIRTHTGEKPFNCNHCSRAFADRSNLRAHLQTHTDIKKYSCKSCSKTFSRMSLLIKHEDGGCPGMSS